MSKHVIFLVHGMGAYADTKWIEPFEAQIRRLYASYSHLAPLPFDDHFEFEPIFYNIEFEALRNLWRDSTKALGSALAGSGISPELVVDLDKLGSATNRDSFINTHVVDVLLYRFLRQVAGTVRAKVQVDILTALKKRGNIGAVRWSVIAHSLGTAVTHDALHEIFTDPTVNPNANFTGVTRPFVLAMIANVSRVLEDGGDFDVYRSRVQPTGNNTAGCMFYLNARNKWDPIPQPKLFAPKSDWPTMEARMRGLYVDCQISDIAQFNVHALEHYLDNPLVHGPLFNSLHGASALQPLLDADVIRTAHAHYVANIRADLLDKALAKLKPLQLAEAEKWMAILRAWNAILKMQGN